MEATARAAMAPHDTAAARHTVVTAGTAATEDIAVAATTPLPRTAPEDIAGAVGIMVVREEVATMAAEVVVASTEAVVVVLTGEAIAKG